VPQASDPEARSTKPRRAGLAKGVGRGVSLDLLRGLRPDDPDDSVLHALFDEREAGW